jgi:3-mercaptopyruvate sulfurtransferase SseA
MRQLLVALLLCAPLIATADEAASLNKLTPQEVSSKLKTKNFYVFDNNDQERFKKSHVPGARWLHPNEYGAGDLPADKTATLVFYCANEH